ncbi:chromosomal replication initiator DnaA [Rhodovarius crocodyli]|uniref:Chromosomal replication initiator DnaA n=1 Tax=Rhodovarius crocodyli TaxID=1979269 RepID=A0A437MD30_9PROT|nr:chromosomal replication initiator DnaA [Rhodovarius crocodyli]RVT95532.1 chromosomal replication initiator DnaA [Rhodovarius crocodyli]
MPRQLALPLDLSPSFAEGDFIPDAANAAAREFLASPEAWPDRRLVLYGPAGAGKTHLAHVMAARHGWRLDRGALLRGLADLPARGWVLDDADLCPDPAALFHALNAAREAGLPLLLTGQAAPARWPFTLPDLMSRLRATTAIGIEAPSDTLLAAMLAKHLADRQIVLAPALQQLLLLHLPRDAASLREAVTALDEAALASGRLNRATVQEVLREMGDGAI